MRVTCGWRPIQHALWAQPNPATWQGTAAASMQEGHSYNLIQTHARGPAPWQCLALAWASLTTQLQFSPDPSLLQWSGPDLAMQHVGILQRGSGSGGGVNIFQPVEAGCCIEHPWPKQKNNSNCVSC